MSADNWALCPKCLAARLKKHDALEMKAMKAYGNLPVDEFKKLEAEAKDFKKKEPEPTLREDYEVCISYEGAFMVRYSGRCTAKGYGFKHSFAHDEQVLK